MNKIIGIILICLLLSACSLIFETDISDSKVTLISPVDNLVTTTNTQTLWWDYVADAEGYNLLIVSPSWDSVVTLVIDSNLTVNKFQVTLSSGEYDWGVSAYNNSSSTVYTIHHISIDTSSDLGSQVVVLKSPAENYNTNDTAFIFAWYSIGAAQSYTFDIKYDSWDGDNVIPTKIDYDDSLSLVLEEGIYYWGIQAHNDFSSTSYAIRNLIVDYTPPGIPTITSPQKSGDTLTSPYVTISWTRPLSSLSEITDSLIIATDTLFSPSKIEGYYVTQDTEVTLDNYSSGYYYCKVRSFDAAGNIGGYSSIKKFYVNEK